ncbi:hypothetical protein J2X31_003244 [Flavobacterium arsenatis]|uniref:Uncharacterized protein n=1 Tax=Flavobacterium arsenatis TaxID=1484332 RepID=A0ABU1TTL9_9FLAO|nr:hypothetical protein [Flavobacterium arsenatis]MDR6969217.1 hypothetical protein [Flavobacterium arsenatis]
MTAIEIKKEISKALDQVPEKLLVDILDLIKEVQSDQSKSSLTSNLKKILSEDSDLLDKLAQ